MSTDNKVKDALNNLRFARGIKLQKEAKLREAENQAAKMRMQADDLITVAKRELAKAAEKLEIEATVWNELTESIGCLDFD